MRLQTEISTYIEAIQMLLCQEQRLYSLFFFWVIWRYRVRFALELTVSREEWCRVRRGRYSAARWEAGAPRETVFLQSDPMESMGRIPP